MFDISQLLSKLGGNTGVLYNPGTDPNSSQYGQMPKVGYQAPAAPQAMPPAAQNAAPSSNTPNALYNVFSGAVGNGTSIGGNTPVAQITPYTSGAQSASQTSFPSFMKGITPGMMSGLGQAGGALGSLLMQRRMQDPNGQNPGSVQQMGQGVTGTASKVNPYGQSQ